MATGQYHHAMHCLTFPVEQGKVRQAKISKIKTQIWGKMKKPWQKKTKIEQVYD